MSLIAEYVSDVLYIRGRGNIVAVSLDQLTPIQLIFDLPAIAREQKEDEEIKSFRDRLKKFPLGEEQIFCDVSTPFVCTSQLKKSNLRDLPQHFAPRNK